MGAPPGSFTSVRMSPDGERIAAINGGGLGSPWVFDLETRQSNDLGVPGSTYRLVWASDEAVYYSSYRGDTPGVGSHVYKRGLTARNEEVFVEANGPGADLGPSLQLTVVDSRPEWLLFASRIDREGGDRNEHTWVVPTSDPTASKPLIDGNAPPSSWARFSPNGNWVIYESSSAVYATPFPGVASQVLVAGDGRCPLVSPEGDRVYFRSGNDVMVVPIAPDTGMDPGTPDVLFTMGEGIRACAWDIFPDGTGFITVRDVGTPLPVNQLRVIYNWFDELKERVPAGR